MARPSGASESGPAALTDSIADEFVVAFFETFPEAATQRGIPGARHDRLTDNSLAALRRIDPASAPGWQASYASLARVQPVGSDSLRAQALARARALPRFLRVEETSLREGLRQGYRAPRAVVEGVIRQLDGLLAVPPDSSPFASPAERDSAPAFRRELVSVVAHQVHPAIRRYRDFLRTEYLPAARATIGVSANPKGVACYRAAVRAFTTLDLAPEEVFDRGMRELARIEGEMRPLAQRIFGTSDLPAVLARLRDDPAYTFRSRQEIVDSSRAALARARAAMPKWFGILPRADVVIQQHPEFRQREGAVAQYNAPAEDGSRPGIFYITTYAPERQSRALLETIAFHEAIPGHHLQIAIAQERTDAHPVTRYFFNSGFVEGWALYAEGLADEMGVFGSDLSRLGMLSSYAWRAARLVLDAGIHTRGWTREQAVEFLSAHTAVAPLLVQGEVDRYISWPGQATAYMLGNLEIRALRAEAERRLGLRFDIRRFPDEVLGHGSLTLPMLRTVIRQWLDREAPAVH